MRRSCDLHLHTTASDGTLTPRELVSLADREGIHTVAITDHDTVSGLDEARAALPSHMTLIGGVEFSCIYDKDPCFLFHLLGYGIDPSSPEIRALVDLGYRERLNKHARRCEYLERTCGITFTDEERDYFATRPAVGRLHLAEAFVRRGLASTKQEAISKYMKSPDFPEGSLSAETAIDGIIRAGGIPVYAHPLGGECEKRITVEECERRLLLLKAIGVCGVECYYSRYSEEDEGYLLSLAEKHGLLVSGGSDFHGKNKTVRIGNLSDSGRCVSPDDLSVLSALFK